MPDALMETAPTAVNRFPEYAAFMDTRRSFLDSYRAWLLTDPVEKLSSIELLSTQEAIRQIHDLLTGRVCIGDVAEMGA
jgi:hypothetical protein